MKNLLEGELDTLMKCTHPHIVDTKEIVHDKHNYYVASEICEGGQLL